MTPNDIMIFTRAITRKPGQDFAQGITSADLGKPDYTRMLVQHAAYVRALESLGLEVTVLEPLQGYPDSYFVEDVAVVTPQVAVIARPGAEARRGEEQAIEPVLARHREIVRIQPPGTLDGGDVLMIKNHFIIGVSERTNQEGAEQLGRFLDRYDHRWTVVPVGEGLHLKSGVSYVGRNTLLMTEAFTALSIFDGYDKIMVDEREAYAANTLLVNDCLIVPQGFSRTRARLESLGLPIIELDVSEARKMDGGLTCMSLRF